MVCTCSKVCRGRELGGPLTEPALPTPKMLSISTSDTYKEASFFMLATFKFVRCIVIISVCLKRADGLFKLARADSSSPCRTGAWWTSKCTSITRSPLQMGKTSCSESERGAFIAFSRLLKHFCCSVDLAVP